MPAGPSTAIQPYLLGSEPNVRFTSIATVGDTIGTKTDGSAYRMVGIPDGLGAFDNGNGTITVLMNHELGQTVGVVREHGAIGAFVSQLVINKATLAVESAKDAISQVQLWNDSTGSFQTSTYAIGRLCSADLAEQSAYVFTDVDGTVYGTQDKIFMTGEEIGSEGKQFGVAVTGAETGIAYELAHMGLFSWENSVSSPLAQRKTVNVSTDDSNGGQVYIYIGEKQTTGNAVEKAGLVNGDLYGLAVTGISAEANGTIANGSFTLVKLGADEDGNGTADGDVSKMTGVQLEAQSNALGVTKFLRPEDVHFDPTNPNVFYFVTTNSFNNPSRLYKATYTDILNPELGGSIVAVLDGTEGQQMLDNITVTAEGKLILQEDPGNQSYHAKIWEYDPVTDKLTELARHDPALFTAGLPGFKTQDEESSGVIDVTNLLGDADTKAYLLDVQSHLNLADPELVQDGQLLAMFVDTPFTEGDSEDNFLFGSAADETLNGRGGNDDMKAGSGTDILNGGSGDDTMDGGRGNDTLIGGSGRDTMFGGDGDDTMRGGSEADTMDGGAGNDDLNGGSENDVLKGGLGADILFGGSGADRFVYTSADESTNRFEIDNRDLIKDFKRGIDKIDLSLIDANTGVGEDQAFSLVGAFTGAAGQLVVTKAGFNKFSVSGDIDGNGSADFEIFVVSKTALAGDDFIL